jgi:hypothetical protein
MKKIIFSVVLGLLSLSAYSQDSTDNDLFDPNAYNDASTAKKYCSQKVVNQTPTKLIGLAWEQNLSFKNDYLTGGNTAASSFNGMGGLRSTINFLPISTNKLILQVGLNTWSSKIQGLTMSAFTDSTMKQVYNNRADLTQLNILAFKPLNEKNFLILQANADIAGIDSANGLHMNGDGITGYGSAIYGWKRNDYTMWGIGASRTYRLGRPLIVPVLLFNKTFNNKWGIESLLPARAAVRYNINPNSMLLGGVELEGQQFALEGKKQWLQRGEIKPRIAWEKKLYKYYWLNLQAGYRVNGRYNIVNKYDGAEKDEIVINNWQGSPFFNVGLYFVSP